MVDTISSFDVQAFEDERLPLLRRQTRYAILIAVPMLAAFGLLDRVTYPELLNHLLVLRLFLVAMLLALAALCGRVRERLPLHLIGVAAAVSIGITMDIMVSMTGGAGSPYYAGNSLALLGVAMLLPWQPRWSLLVAILLTALYVPVGLPRTPEEIPAFANAMTFIVSAGVVGVFSGVLGERLRRSAFETRVKLAKMADAKSEFLASVSHDLRTPLNVVMGYSELLADGTFGPLNEAQSETVERIHDNARGQLELVNDLLDLARIEQGKLSCEIQPTVVRDLLPRLHDMMEVLLRNRPVSFLVELPAGVAVLADPERLHQVLYNLLTNAAKFTEHGEIRLGAEGDGERVSLVVSDTGSGMEADILERAIEPFVRGPDARGGWGLGLAIVSRLVGLMNGELAFATIPGGGTTVRVTLPVAEGEAERLSASAEPARAPGRALEPEQFGRSMPSLRAPSPARQ